MSPGCFTGFMLFFFVISVALLYWAYVKIQFTRTVMDADILVTATVVDMNKMDRRAGNTRTHQGDLVAPSLEFVYLKDTIRYDSEQYSNISSYGIGDTVGIYVNPDKPTDSVINTWSEKWGGAALVGALGLIFFLISAGSLIGSLFK